MALDYESVLELIRGGRLQAARRAIQAQIDRRKKLARPEILQLAYLARQAYLADRTIALLHPIVRSEPRLRSGPATDEEKAEYGMALAQLGAGREALELLSRLDVV